jgi:hypothetical protein
MECCLLLDGVGVSFYLSNEFMLTRAAESERIAPPGVSGERDSRRKWESSAGRSLFTVNNLNVGG